MSDYHRAPVRLDISNQRINLKLILPETMGKWSSLIRHVLPVSGTPRCKTRSNVNAKIVSDRFVVIAG